MKSLWWLLIFGSLVSCRPARSFDKAGIPQRPVYSEESSWMALPWKYDLSDTFPKGCPRPDLTNRKVDVFFIHPTMYFYGSSWNADIRSKRTNRRSERTLMYQASVFNSCARVFAPRYRQAVLKSFFNPKGKKAIDLAYEDVKNAFVYYLQNWNEGRPVIIAGHSQGAGHAFRLLKEFFDGKELQKNLVAAYPVGLPFDGRELKNIPLASDTVAVGVYLTWNTVKWGTPSDIKDNIYGNTPCINPLDISAGSEHVEKRMNLGGVSFAHFRVDREVCDAKVDQHVLWVHRPKKRGYVRIYKSWHVSDYNLFYMNIRTDAERRVRKFTEK